MAAHDQVWIKVNTKVDAGIAELVSLLNSVSGLRTVDSCQGIPGEAPGFVYFWYGDWKTICDFVFGRIAPALPRDVVDEVTMSVELFNGSDPMGKVGFSAEALPLLTAALKRVIG